MSDRQPEVTPTIHTHIRTVEDRGVILVVTSDSPELDWKNFNLGDVGTVRVVVLHKEGE